MSLTNFVLGMTKKRSCRHSNTIQIQNFVKRVLAPPIQMLTPDDYRKLSAEYALKLSLDRELPLAVVCASMGNNNPTKPFERPPKFNNPMLRSPLGRHVDRQDIDDPQPRNQQSTNDNSNPDKYREET